MPQILLVTSSPRREQSFSKQVGQALAKKLAGSDARSHIVARDLASHPLPHIDDVFAVARNTPADKLSASQKDALTLSDELLREIGAADTIVIAAGMINFGIPSQLKAYIDYIVRPGVSFRYSEKGPEGLITGKKVYLVLARGGVYTHGPMQTFNFQEPYLKAVLGFIGLTDVEVIVVEGVAFGPEVAQKALAGALAQVAALTG